MTSPMPLIEYVQRVDRHFLQPSGGVDLLALFDVLTPEQKRQYIEGARALRQMQRTAR